jgi:hypothetical protein
VSVGYEKVVLCKRIEIRTFVEIKFAMSSARAVPCHLSPPLHGKRTNVRGEPNQLNFLSPPCKIMERGSNVGVIIKAL